MVHIITISPLIVMLPMLWNVQAAAQPRVGAAGTRAQEGVRHTAGGSGALALGPFFCLLWMLSSLLNVRLDVRLNVHNVP